MEVEASPGHGLTKLMLFSTRAGFHLLSEEDRERITVCPKHRYELTTHYQKLKSSCSYPSHRGEAKKLKTPRRVNKQVSEIYQARFKRRSIHAPNLTDELSTAEERRLNQFGSADSIWSGK